MNFVYRDQWVTRCTVTIGLTKYYLPYYVRVWIRNEIGDGPIPEPVVGMSAVRGML